MGNLLPAPTLSWAVGGTVMQFTIAKSHFLKPWNPFSHNIKLKTNSSNYIQKTLDSSGKIKQSAQNHFSCILKIK